MAESATYEDVHESIRGRIAMTLVFTSDTTTVSYIRASAHNLANAALGDVAAAVRSLPRDEEARGGTEMVSLEDVLLILGQRT